MCLDTQGILAYIGGMTEQSDLLNDVIAELERREGALRAVAKDSGIPYDTVLRIKNRENDPGYSKVRALADFFRRSAARVEAVELIGTEAAAPLPAEQEVRDAA